jgi:uncharacterized coiled-coil protein SlyX
MNDNKTIEELNNIIAERDERIVFLEARLNRVSKLLAMPDAEIAFSKEAD